ncbi:MAG: rod shape-determining protein MreD [Nitriliruptoraceae bacterium]
MIARIVALAAVLLVALVTQTVLFPLLPTAWFRPDVLLLVVVAVALADGPFPAMRVGFAAGLLTDLLVLVAPLGIATLVLTVVGYVVGALRPYLSPSSVSAPLAVALVTGGAATAAYGTLAMLLGDDRFGARTLVEAAFGVAVYNALIAPLVLRPVAALLERFPRTSASQEA